MAKQMIQQLAFFLVLCCFPLTVFAHMRGSALQIVPVAIGLRVPEEHARIFSEHGEEGYYGETSA